MPKPKITDHFNVFLYVADRGAFWIYVDFGDKLYWLDPRYKRICLVEHTKQDVKALREKFIRFDALKEMVVKNWNNIADPYEWKDYIVAQDRIGKHIKIGKLSEVLPKS
jgi:hypothetical protein